MATDTSHPPCPLIQAMKENAKPDMLYDTMVVVEVGQPSKEFHVHKGLICHHSEYFRGAFKGGFQESKGVVKLQNDRIDDFQRFFNWLYTGKVLAEDETFDLQTIKESIDPFTIYLFAEARGIPLLKNAVVDLIFSNILEQNVIPSEQVSFVYENTPEQDRLRALFVDVFTRWSTVKSETFFHDEKKNLYPKEFLFDICKAAVGSTNSKKPDRTLAAWQKVNKCEYHDHTNINAPR